MSGKTSSEPVVKPNLTLVSDDIYQLDRKPETSAQRIRRLQLEAKILAREQIQALEQSMRSLAAQARDLAEGGEAYPVGVREMASRLSDDLDAKAQTIEAVMDRIPLPPI